MNRIGASWGDLFMMARQRGVDFSTIDSNSGGADISKTLFFLGAAAVLGILAEAERHGEDVVGVTLEMMAELDAFLAPEKETMQ